MYMRHKRSFARGGNEGSGCLLAFKESDRHRVALAQDNGLVLVKNRVIPRALGTAQTNRIMGVLLTCGFAFGCFSDEQNWRQMRTRFALGARNIAKNFHNKGSFLTQLR